MQIARYKLLWACLLSQALQYTGTAQTDTGSDTLNPAKLRSMFSMGAGLQHGFIFAHSPAVENTKGAHPTGVELNVTWQRNDKAVWDLCRCYPRKGLLLTYYDYDTKILGKESRPLISWNPCTGSEKMFSSPLTPPRDYPGCPIRPIRSITPPTCRTAPPSAVTCALCLGFWAKLTDDWWLNASRITSTNPMAD